MLTSNTEKKNMQFYIVVRVVLILCNKYYIDKHVILLR